MAVADQEQLDLAVAEPEPEDAQLASAMDDRAWTLSWPLRVVLGACLFGAACIHLAMAPSHSSEWFAEGVAFAAAGWIQIALAVAVLTRPSKQLLQLAAATNAVLIGAWMWTRTAGPPVGPEAGRAHPAGFVDLTCVSLEVAIVITAAVGVARSGARARTSRSPYMALSAAVAAGVLVLATAAIVSPSAAEHGHSEAAASSHDHAAAAPADHHSDGPVMPAAEGGSALSSPAHEHGHSAPASSEPVDDKGLAALSNGEMAHEYGRDQPLDANTRALLVHQLSLTRAIADRFPTLKDARAAGSAPAGSFVPGMGIHMSTPRTGMPDTPPPDPSFPTVPGTLSDAEIMRPANLLYDGTTDDARLAGFMYYSMSPTEPEGFAGPNDHWHTHGALCIKMGGADGKIEVLHPAEKTGSSCTSIGGLWVEKTTYMVHVWTIPGYESNRGVFSDINPAITCPDGTYYTVPEADTEKYKVSKCLSNPS